jgi:hypothetical protein
MSDEIKNEAVVDTNATELSEEQLSEANGGGKNIATMSQSELMDLAAAAVAYQFIPTKR